MKYFFLLGINTNLSFAEILSIFPANIKTKKILDNIIFLETKQKIKTQTLLDKMGGTIKIGLIDKEIKEKTILEDSILNIIKNKKIQGKLKFGISCYGKKINTKDLGMKIKRKLQKEKINSRFVLSKDKTLSSVVVRQNKLHNQGIEIILINLDKKIILAHTQAVQNFKLFSKRDYGRPARDDYSGMLPPKLAQIMINLSKQKKDSIILDPFCGSGTILTEASLMGYKNLIGTDISQKAILNTRKNIDWTLKTFKIDTNYKLYQKSALGLNKLFKKQIIDAIITEPYLGPQRGKINIKKIKKELEILYSNSLQEFKKILKPKGLIVMVWPILKHNSKTEYIEPNIKGFKNIGQKNLIYGRPKQKVWRKIIILQKI